MPGHDACGNVKFSLGRTDATRGALSELTADEIFLALKRHAAGDWGDLDKFDEEQNELALATEGRLLSVYLSLGGKRFYVITECDRSATTVLLPHEY